MVVSITAIPRRFGAWLALLALALQVGLSIGHVHKIGLDWRQAAGLGWAKPTPAPADEDSPAGKPAPPPQDRCPICFGLAVSGTFILAVTLAVILAPVLETERIHAARHPTVLTRRHFSPAQQRAPPPVAIAA